MAGENRVGKLVLGAFTALLTFAAALAGSLIGIAQVNREGELSLRDLRIDAYASYLAELISYHDELDEWAVAVLSDGSEDDDPARSAVVAQRPLFNAEHSKVVLLASREPRQQAFEVIEEINRLQDIIKRVRDEGHSPNMLTAYLEVEDPLWKAVTAFQETAYLEITGSD